MLKRTDYLSWDDYFMSLAFLTGMRSKDPSTQVGACIVNSENRIVGIGYNGFPSGIPDDSLPWAKVSAKNDELETKYPYVCHAELNAVLNKNAESCRGCRLYATLFPCNECAKVMIQAGIRKVLYASDKHGMKPSSKASRTMLELAGVEMVQYVPRDLELRLALRYPEDEPQAEPQAPGSPDRNRVGGGASAAQTVQCWPCAPPVPQRPARRELVGAAAVGAFGGALAAVLAVAVWRARR